MPRSARVFTRSLALITILTGCAAPQAAPPETPEAAANEQEPTATAKQAEKSEAPQETAESAPDPRSGDGLRKASRPPGELITGPNLVYVFNFKESAVGVAAKEECEANFGDDPAGYGACMQKARSKVPVELVRFIKEPSGEHWWVTYNRYKGNLLKWHRVQFMPGKEGEDRITLNLIGKDKGIAPMARVPRHLEIELPNDYSIVVNDPDRGPMMYDAKIGTMDTE